MNNSNNDIFKDLFVLELANNHWGDVERGLRIIREHGRIVKKYNINAAIKFQFRNTDTFIHPKYLDSKVSKKDKEVTSAPGTNTRYIKKTLSTNLSKEDYKEMIDEVKRWGMVTMSSPFDEKSVDLCQEFDLDIIKIGSGVAKSWPLVEKIADIGKPAIISNGGTGVEDLDRVVDIFAKRNVPLAINHCVSIYPSEDHELDLDQVDFLKNRYPNHVIGFSTHEYNDWHSSLLISYAKGARTWERHIDIEADGIPVSKYCSLPHQIEEWFKYFQKAKMMCGECGTNEHRQITEKEKDYILSVSRGVYALKDLPKGYKLTRDNLEKDFYLAIPAEKGQFTERDLDEEIVLKKDLKKDDPIYKDEV